ncbi:uncharacterized protein LOC116765713 [Danaus plexippus]|uniref:uncharacterized protein LOC116765713 n=1 Tax=Danaus plexippus TaxID=13037 RepID=UPI002AB0201E|nr:uncharacterized protein LOC116765713 [Danaus plexippus]XP_061378006.1 uncharacterized protein LOC116765713 [Danaus plexippus]
MDNFDRDLDDLLDLTDSESSSSSNPGIFETNQPFVLELHELKKDEPAADQVTPDTKTKKKKKRRNLPVNENKTATSSTSSVSESVPSAADAAMKEEFYDANESYHLLSAEVSQVNPAASAALAQAHSEHGQDKTDDNERRSSANKQPSIINKPVVPPK